MLAWGFPPSTDWKDHALDAGVPVVCSLVVYLVSLLLRYRAEPASLITTRLPQPDPFPDRRSVVQEQGIKARESRGSG